MLRHTLSEWLKRFENACTETIAQIKPIEEITITNDEGQTYTSYKRPLSGICDVRKRLTIIESLEIYRQLIQRWDEVQALTSRTIKFNILNLKKVKDLNELIGLSGYCHTASTIAFLKSIEYDSCLEKDMFPWEVIPPQPIIPKDIRNPPKFKYDMYYIDSAANVIKAKTKEAIYIPNYRAHEVYEGKRGINSTSTFEERVRHGAVTMLQRMVKLRGASIQESFSISMLSYKCSECVRLMKNSDVGTGAVVNNDHVCLFRSNSVRWLKEIFGIYPEIPFLMTRDGIKFASNCGVLSTQLPLLFFQFLEQMILTTDGTYSSTWEGVLCCEWVDRARIGLFSEMFSRRKVISLIREKLFRQSALLGFKNLGLHIYQCSDVKHAEEMTNDEIDSMKKGISLFHPTVEAIFTKLILRHYNDEEGRWLAVLVKGFGSALLYVMGATSLSLEQSAQGTLGHGDPLTVPKFQIEINGQWFTADWHYLDPEIEEMVNIAKGLVEKADPEYSNWEYGFYNVQTTNSAGNVKETVEMRRKILEKELGEHARLMVKIENTRILDCVQKILSSFLTPEALAAGMRMVKKAGERHQVGRRPRVIQMVGTEGQLAAFVIHNTIRPAYKKTRFTSSGKNSGDIRDMALVLEISGNDGYKSSLDVVGMDSSTKPFHTNISLSCAFARLTKEKIGTPAFFLGSEQGSDENFFLVRARHVNRNGIPEEEFNYELTYPQFVLALGAMNWTAPTRFMDGYFQEYVETSRMVFRSGLLNTADQHTFIGVMMYSTIEKRMRDGWYKRTKSGGRDDSDRRMYLESYEKKVTLLGSVLGDDQVAGVSCFGITDPDVINGISMDICNETKFMMEKLGYACEPDVSKYCAEFLKQRGVCGAPELFPERLLLFSSERGDMAGSMPLDRTKIMLSMIDEKIGRARHSGGYYGVQMLTSWVCGTVCFALSANDQVTYRSGRNWKRVERSKGKISRRWMAVFKDNTGLMCKWSEHAMYYREWISGGMRAVFLGLGLLWGCSDVLGVPFPAVFNGDICLTAGTSVFTTPSNAMTHYLLSFCQRSTLEIKTLWHDYKRNSGLYGDPKKMNLVKYVDTQLSEAGLSDVPNHLLYVYGIGSSLAGGLLITPLELWYDLNLLSRLGGFGSWIAEEIFKDIRIEREKYTLPTLDMWKNTANHLLPADRRRASEYAGYKLYDKFGVKCPSAILWAERPGSKIDQALFEVKRVGTEDVREIENVFSSIEKLGDLGRKYVKRLGMGCFHCVKKGVERRGHGINIYSRGWGHTCTPKSVEARILGAIGFPAYHGFNYEAIRERLFIDGKLPGDPKLYMKIAREALSHSEEAYMLLCMAVGLGKKQSTDLKQMIEEGVVGFEEARFALAPRKTFLFDVSRRRGALNFYTRSKRRSVKTYIEIMGMALLLMEPWRYSEGIWEIQTSHRLRSALGRR
ncbi:RNA-dependent RNA polymerase [Kundal virus]|uniref:RNA-dependent RNA polymerase n=1 Tax=Kundal virus TaxID=2290890 RepID=A0A499RSG4_9REOV|nr:RNA-dependent RNA polymerase [Kundal virus]AXG65493.1 RNA-dependent RNA polymerase [Kundal virus]